MTLSHSLIGEQETGSFLSQSADTACKASLTERELDEGIDYFAVQGDLDRAKLLRAASDR